MALRISAGRRELSVGALWVGAPRHFARINPTATAPMVYLLPSLSREGQGWVSLSFQFSALVAAAVVAATLVLATLGDVLFARCSGSRSRVNLLPTHLVGELAAELGGYGATQSALAVGSVQHLGGCHV